jgi:hypothetical protein
MPGTMDDDRLYRHVQFFCHIKGPFMEALDIPILRSCAFRENQDGIAVADIFFQPGQEGIHTMGNGKVV